MSHSMDPLIAHLSIDRATIELEIALSINRLRTAEFAQSIDRAAIESAQSVDCLRSISSHLATCLLHIFFTYYWVIYRPTSECLC